MTTILAAAAFLIFVIYGLTFPYSIPPTRLPDAASGHDIPSKENR